MTVYECIVIGAGPGGLAASFYLQQNGVRYLTLEKGGIGQSWKNMSACFDLITPMWTNALPGDRCCVRPFKHITCNQYGEYLEHYAARANLHIQCHTNVHHVDTEAELLRVHTDTGVFTTQTLISAAGYFSNPYQPDIEIDAHPGSLVLHAADYRSIEQLRKHKVQSLLIVGKRNTAGQLLADLHRAGLRVALSIRNPLTFRDNSSLKGVVKEFLYYFWEVGLILRDPHRRQNSFPPMDSRDAKAIIDSGTIEFFPNVQRISGKTVTFADQSSSSFDAVIFATGYRPELRHLAVLGQQTAQVSDQTVAHLEQQHIFLLGIDNLYNFRSRYIRGIRQDARVVVHKVQQALTTFTVGKPATLCAPPQ